MTIMLILTLYMVTFSLIGKMGLPPNLVAAVVFVLSLMFIACDTGSNSRAKTVAYSGALLAIVLAVAWTIWGPLVYVFAEAVVETPLMWVDRVLLSV